VKRKMNGGVVTGTAALVNACLSVTVTNGLHLLAIVAIHTHIRYAWLCSTHWC
jgi:hypothetical protein